MLSLELKVRTMSDNCLRSQDSGSKAGRGFSSIRDQRLQLTPYRAHGLLGLKEAAGLWGLRRLTDPPGYPPYPRGAFLVDEYRNVTRL